MVSRLRFSFLVLLFLLSFSCVSAADWFVNDSVDVFQTSLPFSNFTFLNVTFNPNSTLDVFNSSSPVSFFNVSYPSSFYFNDTNQSFIYFNYTVDNFVFFGNQTVVYSFLLNNSFNNNTIFYDVYFNLVDDFVVGGGSRPYELYQTLDGGRGLNITTNLLPLEESYMYTLKGLFNETVNLSCDSWLSCPVNVTFASDNTVSFYVNLSIPKGSVNGTYKKNIYFFGYNSTVNSSFDITLIEPEYLFQNFILRPECMLNDGAAVSFDCWEEFLDFNYKQQKELVTFYKDLNYPICENLTVIEYVMAGSIEDDINDAYGVCKSDRDAYRSDYNICTGDLISMTNDYNSANNNYNVCNVDLVNASAQGWSKCQEEITSEISASKKRSRRTIWIVVFIVLGLGVLIFLVLVAWSRSKKSVYMG